VGRDDVSQGADDEHVSRIAQLVKERRRGTYTVHQLAARAGVSPSVVSEIERGKANPSLNTLMKVSTALGISMSEFFTRESEPTEGREADGVVRVGNRPSMTFPAHGVVYHRLTPELLALGLYETELAEGYSNETLPAVHPGWEIVHVLTGTLEHHHGDAGVILLPGDSVTFDSGITHWLRNPGPGRARALIFQTPSAVL
jgi:transcriptional regulator with XRE-family HTH domain